MLTPISVLMRANMSFLSVFTFEYNTDKTKMPEQRDLKAAAAVILETCTVRNGGYNAANLTAHH